MENPNTLNRRFKERSNTSGLRKVEYGFSIFFGHIFDDFFQVLQHLKISSNQICHRFG